MESEKVKEIKKALEICTQQGNLYCHEEKTYEKCPYYEDCKKAIQENNSQSLIMEHALMLINEFESENSKLLEENELLRNAKVVYETVDYCYEDLKKAEKRIAELEKENEEQYKRIMELEQDLVHADENVFYRECNVTLRENEIKEQALKQFAERLKVKTRVIVDFYKDHADKCFNGISEKGIDETLEEFLK